MTRFDDGEPALGPHNFAIQTLRALWDSLPQLLGGMVWLNLCLAPSFVLALVGLNGPAAVIGVLLGAPGWVALQQMQGRLVQGRVATLGSLLSSFRRFWLPGVRLGALALVLPLVTFLAAAGLGAAAGAAGVPAASAANAAAFALVLGGLGGALVASLLVLYAVPLLVLYDQEVGTALRNAAILSARHLGNTVGMLALAVLCGLAAAWLNSGLVFVLPVLYGMFVVNNCRLAVELENELEEETA